MDTIKPRTIAELGVPASVPGEAQEVTTLVNRAKAGDAQAFGELMHLYEGRIISIGIQMGLSRDDALDACQDAFVKVFRYIGGFRSGQTFFRWLYRIAINSIYDHLRWCHPPGVISVEEMEVSEAGSLRDTSTAVDRRVESADLTKKLLSGLDCLTRQERAVFVLRDMQQVSTGEIGRIMHLSQVTIRRHCMSARHKLKERLFPKKGLS